MEKIDISCASEASTTICLSMDQPSPSSAAHLGGRAIDRHNPIIKDGRRIYVPCTFQLQPPIDPKPHHLLDTDNKKSSSLKRSDENKTKKKKNVQKLSIGHGEIDDYKEENSFKEIEFTSKKKCITPPAVSSRYLLSENIVDGLSENKEEDGDGSSKIVESISKRFSSFSSLFRKSFNPDRPPSVQAHVVVLRVSLHCKGCEGKVRKHLSRMDGVTSYNIDFKAKKVTIVGDVTPLSVLASVSKVKNAQFWPENSTLAPPAVNQEVK
ncbi:protein SODIUM POTASSIUM ROOT DEFECTIVE 1-like [Rutidosis leptorrhynchoides]|uniref:protein SODIUM POTASSIUM ROOT DEFECTIVE 1-like n=1 Tax=Rutidosis leptorrhynchoides TaxID=125765 RepID=UPI003A98DFBF